MCPKLAVKSYLSGRSHVVKIENNFSCSVPDECGVPQGSVMGPILFSLYSAPIYDIIQAHGLSSMIYADDVQVYLTFPISDRETAVQRINKCITDIISWSIQNKLIINASKTEVLHLMSKFAPTPPHPLVVSVDGVDIAAATKVRNLGVIMNKHLSMSGSCYQDLPICNHIHKKNWTNSPVFGQEINRNPSSCTDHVPC